MYSGLYFPIFFLQLNAIQKGVPKSLAFYAVSNRLDPPLHLLVFTRTHRFQSLMEPVWLVEEVPLSLLEKSEFTMSSFLALPPAWSLYSVRWLWTTLQEQCLSQRCMVFLPADVRLILKSLLNICWSNVLDRHRTDGARSGVSSQNPRRSRHTFRRLLSLHRTWWTDWWTFSNFPALYIHTEETFSGSPVAGALLTSHYYWWRPVLYAGLNLGLSTVLLTASRIMLSQRKDTQII